MFKRDFIKVGCVTPKLKVGNPIFNVEEMLKLLGKTYSSITVFPELSVTSYTCNDLFFQSSLLEDTIKSIKYLLDNNIYNGLLMIGAPIDIDGVLYNCAIVIQKNKILGIVPKFYLPNTGEFYEKRWFKSGFDIVKKIKSINYIQQNVPFGNIIFENKNTSLKLGIEICEDMWAPISPGNVLSLNGANMIINLSASNETLGKDSVRRISVLEHSRRNAGAYLYSSAGVSESTSETVFSGHNIIALNGELIKETENFNKKSEIIYGDIDLSKIGFKRRTNSSYRDMMHKFDIEYQRVVFDLEESKEYDFQEQIDSLPFVPKKDILHSFEKIAQLQENALAKRIKHINLKSLIIGISGGLDSTLALLVACRVYDELKIDRKQIIGVSMPGLATSDRTKNNAKNLMEGLGVTRLEIDISNHVKDHFNLIGHDGVTEDITYENTQARARTMILMNLANKHQGIVLGTGDLSELALGWCTYNGDQMSMYNINAGLPKTLIKFMIENYANFKFDEKIRHILEDIVNTPITPELASNQKTESIVGKYEVNDYIIYRFLVCGDSEERIEWLVKKTFNLSDDDVKKYIENFFNRFYSQQFKRQASPDSPKILDISLSPRSDFRMPSDVKR